jgi:hypothetical protein
MCCPTALSGPQNVRTMGLNPFLDKNQQIYKAFFVHHPSKDDSNVSLILQIHQKVIVYNLYTMKPKSFLT